MKGVNLTSEGYDFDARVPKVREISTRRGHLAEPRARLYRVRCIEHDHDARVLGRGREPRCSGDSVLGEHPIFRELQCAELRVELRGRVSLKLEVDGLLR